MRVRGKRRKRTRCKTKLVAALATTTTRAAATLSSSNRVRARGTARVTRNGATVTLTPRGSLSPGVYTLKITRRGKVILSRSVLVR